MPGLSVVDDDNGMELTGLRQASLTFKHTDFQGWRDNPDWTIEKYVRGILASECDPWNEIVKLASGSNLTFESRKGFPRSRLHASLAHANRHFHHC
jgi:hypothetical protein